MSSVKPRRSNRLKNATKDTHTEVALEPENDEPSISRPSKRQKTTRVIGRKPAKTKGKLSNLPQMPLDILFEIFKLLTPLDLLRLARTTKALRSILMRRSAITVWKAARLNVPDLPDCPEGASEPAYANFMFTTHCHECLEPRAPHNFAPRNLRYCKTCVNDKVIWSPRSTAIVRETLGDRSSVLYTDPIVFDYLLPQGSGHLSIAWFRDDFIEFQEGWLKVRDDDAQKAEFLAAREKITSFARERDGLYIRWIAKKHEARVSELEEVRSRRADAIKERLEEAGRGPTLERMNLIDNIEFQSHPLVKQSRPLTDRIWRNIERKILALMDSIHTNQLKRERNAIIRARREAFASAIDDYAKTQPVDAVLPLPADVYEMEMGFVLPLKDIIETAPNDVEFSQNDAAELVSNLPQLCEEWKTVCTAKLLDIYNAAMSSPPFAHKAATEDVLRLGRTVFTCQNCEQCLWYPYILNHLCISRAHMFSKQHPFADELLPTAGHLDSTSWLALAPKLLVCRPEDIVEAAGVVRACGFDPNVATHDDLDSEAMVLTCTPDVDIEVMGWRRAVNVACKMDYSGPFTKFDRAKLFRLWREAEFNYYTQDADLLCVCSHCRSYLFSNTVVDHMILNHNSDGQVVRSDFWIHPDNSFLSTFSFAIPEEALQ